MNGDAEYLRLDDIEASAEALAEKLSKLTGPRCQAEVWRTRRAAMRCVNEATIERVCPGPHHQRYPILLCEVHNRVASLKPIFAYPDGEAPMAIWVDSPKGEIV